jgi:hypothetical protein
VIHLPEREREKQFAFVVAFSFAGRANEFDDAVFSLAG